MNVCNKTQLKGILRDLIDNFTSGFSRGTIDVRRVPVSKYAIVATSCVKNVNVGLP